MRDIQSLADIPALSPNEIETRLAEAKAKHQAEVDAITTSPTLKRVAKTLSALDDSCGRCVYCGHGFFDGFCNYPHSDGYIMDLGVDECYEGVLRYLVKNNAKRTESI